MRVNRSRHGKGEYAHGFTLVEVLVAMTLVGIILAALFSGLRLVGRSWEAAEARIERANEMRVVLDLLRRQLRQTQGLNVVEEGQWVLAFAGEPHAVQFVTPMFPYLGVGGLYMTEVREDASSEGTRLTMRLAPYRPDQSRSEMLRNAETYELARGLEGAEFQYFGRRDGQEDEHWGNAWDNARRLPEIVRLSVRTEGEGWPELTVPVSQ